ncbi:MAG TPA: SpoIIE family protein phosphatase, partial [Ilumatobacteraceae bacterium]|nr:SpoIIE family protein phosphatase [Ilumatobacteraceae bacterium]
RHGDGFTVVVASAGHPPGIVLDLHGNWSEIDVSGPPAGWYATSYGETTIELRRGDRVVMYTDGLSEARTVGGMLGVAGVASLVSEVSSARDTIGSLVAAIDGGTVDVSDDIAAVVFRVGD